MLTYRDLEITIRSDEVCLKVIGEPDCKGPPNFTEETFRELETLRSDGLPEQYGRELFNATFADNTVAERYRSLIGKVVTGDARWRVRLSIPEAEERLQALWWECLHDNRNRPLAIGQKTPVSRFLSPEEVRPPITVERVRILVVIANPKGLGKGTWLNAPKLKKPQQHLTIIREAIKDYDRVKILTLEDGERASVDNIRGKLLAGDGVNVLHLVAHGGKGVLLLEDANGGVDDVDEGRLAALVSGVPGLQLVVLAACEGAKRSTADAFVGLAPRMLSSEVPAIIAMQDIVSERAATTFAKWFYPSLLKSADVDGRVDVAITTARDRVFLEKDVRWDWAIPVLFMRGEGQLFELAPTEANVGAAATAVGGLPQETMLMPLHAATRSDEGRQLFKLLIPMNEGQLKAVCWNVDLAFDNLDGDSHEERVISLVETCRSGGRFAELAEAIAVIRRGETKRQADEARRQADQTDAIVLDITKRLGQSQ